MDRIRIKDLEIYCHHGALKEENILGQKFMVSVDLYMDTSKAGCSDELYDSINYAEVSYYIKDFMEKHTYQLIEAVAENLSLGILKKFLLVDHLRLEIKKPWAPILLPLDTVSVEIIRGWHSAFLSIGSNLGKKEDNLNQAIALLEEELDTSVVQTSDYTVTKPVGGVEQDDFLNAALEIKTLRRPTELLDLIEIIEKKLKRVRDIHWGPRTIDLDILFYDEEVMQTQRLCIPHKEMHLRAFVLEPMLQIAPNKNHPIYKKNIFELLQNLRQAEGESNIG